MANKIINGIGAVVCSTGAAAGMLIAGLSDVLLSSSVQNADYKSAAIYLLSSVCDTALSVRLAYGVRELTKKSYTTGSQNGNNNSTGAK